MEKLNRWIKSKGLIKGKIAETMGISRHSLYAKLNGDTSFTIDEAKTFLNFGMTVREWKDIFLS